jgi:hypothetical protein
MREDPGYKPPRRKPIIVIGMAIIMIAFDGPPGAATPAREGRSLAATTLGGPHARP